MTTSGTVGLTQVSVQSLIDHGARRAGKLAEELTSEQVTAAKESLWYLLSNMANRGIQYWCIQKNVLGMNVDRAVYAMPVGTVDVLNSNYRTLTRNSQNYSSSSGDAEFAFDGDTYTACQLTDNTGYIGIANGSNNPVNITTIGILPSVTGPVAVEIQYSFDNLTWVTIYAPGVVQWVDQQWIYYDLEPSTTAPLWRIKQISGVNMGVAELVFGSDPMEIPLARLNRDDYTNLPNKSFTSQRPLQFWFNRTIPQPEMYLWPVPGNPFPQIVAWCHRQIQDVGELSGQLEIPQRWYLAIQNMLAYQMALELPGVTVDRIGLCKANADETWLQAEQEERDKSPIYFSPNISPYTR